MLVVMGKEATKSDIDTVCKTVTNMGFTAQPISNTYIHAVHIIGYKGTIDTSGIKELPNVSDIIQIDKQYKLITREIKKTDTIIDVNNVKVGGKKTIQIAGPCAIESEKQLLEIAIRVKEAGADILRGGAFKPRTSPYSFQGLGKKGLDALQKAREETGLPAVTEVLDTADFSITEEITDIIQIGARNMQNFPLLKRAGQSSRPVLLKRGMSATLKEFLLAAEYIIAEGNPNVILCERGIRTFTDYTRFTLDISIVPELKRITHLPVIVDPSHACGKRELIPALAKAAVAAGADGLIVEVHNNPDEALSDGQQSLTPDSYRNLLQDINKLSTALSR